MSEARYHQPVMLSECISALNIDPEGVYVDVTFGGGGHSLKILEKIKGGRLIAFDQDEDAKREAEKIDHRSLTFCQANFMYMKRYLKLNQITKVNGILADLGISSHQIDAPDRGFSTRFDGPLDMRMDVQGPITAANILNEYSEEKLHKIFGMYGEVKNAKTAAKVIVQTRLQKKFERNFDLLAVLKPIAPRGKDFKYYAQVFQALRIEVNKEMEALESFLMQCGEVMETGGRLVVMSYHSLEDRMVKNYINTGKVYGELEKDFYGNPIRPFGAINRKPITAGEEELEQNNRARSAKLRIAEKL
ncbi:MAG: 16S rRNA (cytosine(1402)-N(4))-methyltransferase RsmH [Cyclobacteriaceae bacterium]|jgi:16S rRNA (cytosine1402-N4)-methyltransferase|nr:16S rRNA (cytosine(1402)-N(4))-methyltransferase RsmH [Cyclobacteriaceae bacterium]